MITIKINFYALSEQEMTENDLWERKTAQKQYKLCQNQILSALFIQLNKHSFDTFLQFDSECSESFFLHYMQTECIDKCNIQ